MQQNPFKEMLSAHTHGLRLGIRYPIDLYRVCVWRSTYEFVVPTVNNSYDILLHLCSTIVGALIEYLVYTLFTSQIDLIPSIYIRYT